MPQNRRRASAVAIVVLLHLIFLYGLLHAVNVKSLPKLLQQTPITIWLPVQPPPKSEEDKELPVEAPSMVMPAEPDFQTAPITLPPVSKTQPKSDEDGMGKLGHYLENCSAGNYGALSQKEWANCLGGLATRDRNGLQLGNLKTQWELQHPAKPVPNAKEAHGFGECAHNDPKRLMGLPCFQYNGQAPTVANGQQ